MKQLNPTSTDSGRVNYIRINNNVMDAVLDHFNDIQRGNFHAYSPNYINPNAHGKGISSLINTHGGINSPLDQFLIKEFITFFFNLGGNMKLLFTNMAFYLSIAAFLGSGLNVIYNKLKGLVSNL
ncbi:MAG: hypothetical protein O7C58_06635 [Rickettsia endosymbiont of Ixodes persulcatus]|nr:hypothetical protein [Rickettsia endosymbiont of Ixodes persulcatus]